MDANILTTLGSMLVVLVGLLSITAYLRSDIQGVKDDLQEIKGDLKEDIQEVKDDLKEDIQRMDTDIRRVDDRVWLLSAIIQHHLGVSPDDLSGVPEPERPARDRDRAET